MMIVPSPRLHLEDCNQSAADGSGSDGPTLIGQECGYSVLEVTVALALLVSVLLPAVGGALHVMTRSSAQSDIEALNRAQAQLEETLRHRQFRDDQWLSEDERWAVQRAVARRDEVVTIEIRVWRARGPIPLQAATEGEPLVRLATARLGAPADAPGDATNEEFGWDDL